jgi:maltooligosyltrehalose synthase
VAFARRLDSEIAIIAVPRFAHALLGESDRITFDPSVWNDTALIVDGASPVVWRNIFDDQTIGSANGEIAAISIFSRCPVALLIATQ